MKHSLLFFTGLFLISASLNSMEITNADFVFKPKKHGLLGRLCYATNDQKFANFATKKDSNRTFANHELLLVKKMNDEEIPKEITNEILKIRYHQIMNNEYKNKQKDICLPIISENLECDINKALFWSNKGQQKAIYYLTMHAHKNSEDYFEIEGINPQFSQEMAKQIDSMPLSIKNHLFKKDSYYIKTSEPTFINAYLGKGETRKNAVNRIANSIRLVTGVTMLTSGVLNISNVSELVIGTTIEEKLGDTIVTAVGLRTAEISTEINEIIPKDELLQNFSLGFMAAGAAIYGLIATADYIQDTFTPKTFDEEMTMLGFEKRSVFPTLEYKK